MPKNMHYILFCWLWTSHSILFEVIFLLFVWQDQLGENYPNIFPYLGSQNTLGKKYALHVRNFQIL